MSQTSVARSGTRPTKRESKSLIAILGQGVVGITALGFGLKGLTVCSFGFRFNGFGLQGRSARKALELHCQVGKVGCSIINIYIGRFRT